MNKVEFFELVAVCVVVVVVDVDVVDAMTSPVEPHFTAAGPAP